MRLFRRRRQEKPGLAVSCGRTFEMEVHGESHYQPAIIKLVSAAEVEQTAEDACRCEFTAQLRHELDNRHDASAVAVTSLAGQPLGYLPREIAAEFAPLLDVVESEARVFCEARAYGRRVGYKQLWRFGIWLDLPTASEFHEALTSFVVEHRAGAPFLYRGAP